MISESLEGDLSDGMLKSQTGHNFPLDERVARSIVVCSQSTEHWSVQAVCVCVRVCGWACACVCAWVYVINRISRLFYCKPRA